jgi:hypothetical protein
MKAHGAGFASGAFARPLDISASSRVPKVLRVDLVVVADTSARQIGGSVGRWSRQAEK